MFSQVVKRREMVGEDLTWVMCPPRTSTPFRQREKVGEMDLVLSRVVAVQDGK